MKKRFKIFIYSFSIMVLFVAAFILGLYIQTARETASRIEKGAIDNIIFSESPVYYDDEETPIGVFFDKTHRKYIHYSDIPKVYIKALIASEDGNFFHHPGFELKAILRAFIANLKAGRVIQGGSTITQQTAKNIFKREKRTYIAKLKELMQALLLERRYSKEEILEMYVNQFFVTGFGKGLRIASEYFFNKEAEDLDLVEAAFLAGSVKGPFLYNPFTKKTDTEKREAIEQAQKRKNYVLQNMKKLNMITDEEYQEAVARDIPFNEGTITYRLTVIMDYVREQLESEYFKTILWRQGVDNIATSGMKIYTSINKEIQQGALKSVRRHLPLLDVTLSGYDPKAFQDRYLEHGGMNLENPIPDFPFFAKITHINDDKQNPSLIVAWENGGGFIDYEGLATMGEAWLRWKLGNWAIFDRSHIPDFLKLFNVGDLVSVQFMGNNSDNIKRRLMLSEIPDLEGGIIVLRKGMIKAMVGGFFDRYFNRASDAKRQLGSIFKPIVYTAALQLKWNILDPLMNTRNVFTFENTLYIPKPDHHPPSDKVSMAWAGIKSENLATVWLLYHLTDHLNMNEFRHVTELLGLNRKRHESYREYVNRIRDNHGVVVNQAALMEAAFEESKREIESDLIFSGFEDALDNLHRLHFKINNGVLDLRNNEDYQIYRRNFQRLKELQINMKKYFNKIIQLVENSDEKETITFERDLGAALGHFYYTVSDTNVSRIIYSESPTRMNLPNLQPVSVDGAMGNIKNVFTPEIWIDGLMPSNVIDLLQESVKKNYKKLLEYNRYDFEVLYRIRDFRSLVNLLYVKKLAEEMGITTDLDPVLSFPLGANAISILDAALAYQTMMEGHLYPIQDAIYSGMVPIITKICDRDGETIWEYGPKPKRVVADNISRGVTEILRLVMLHGTGSQAKNEIQLTVDFEDDHVQIPIPSFGKTGTANRYTNSSFIGFIPGPNPDIGQLDIREGFVIASYVGYDDNRPMRGKHVIVYGASGALPLWIDTANTIVNTEEFKKDLQVADLAFDIHSVPFLDNKKLRLESVSPISGLPFSEQTNVASVDSIKIYSPMETTGNMPILKRVFEPFEGAYDEEKTNH